MTKPHWEPQTFDEIITFINEYIAKWSTPTYPEWAAQYDTTREAIILLLNRLINTNTRQEPVTYWHKPSIQYVLNLLEESIHSHTKSQNLSLVEMNFHTGANEALVDIYNKISTTSHIVSTKWEEACPNGTMIEDHRICEQCGGHACNLCGLFVQNGKTLCRHCTQKELSYIQARSTT